MSIRSLLTGAALFAIIGISGAGDVTARERTGVGQAPGVAPHREFLDHYCVTCHNQRLNTAGLALDLLDPAHVGDHPEVWEKVVRKLRAGAMPPQGVRRPQQPESDAEAAWFARLLDRAAAGRPDPGRPVLHRLNRTEYGKAIRDLLGVDLDVAALLPPDDSSFGFDNIGDVLGLSPVLLDRYLVAADKISAVALGDPSFSPSQETYRVRQDLSQDQHIEGLPLGTVGGLLGRHTFPLDAEYDFQAKLFRSNIESIRGLEYARQLEILIDGERVLLVSFGGDEDFALAVDNPTVAGDAVDARLRIRIPVKAGTHDVGVDFIQQRGEGTRRLQPALRSSADTFDSTGHAHVESLTITGPFNPTGPGETASRRRVLVCRPRTTAAVDEDACARRIVATLARRAYRRPVTSAEIADLMAYYRKGRESTLDKGVQMAVRRVLASPKFLLRIERDRLDVAAGIAYPVSDLELASRLSFFLWSSIPDEDLMSAAESGRLREPVVLATQVRRMLADPKAETLSTVFAGQWLQLRNLRRIVPNSTEFPDFDDNLRHSFQREAELFFDSIVREDRSVRDLLTADYTYVDERLARHYGIPNVYGSQFRRVVLTDDRRKGLLGKGGVLTVTSHTDRTSPVVRGKWLLENIVGTPPPPPPANVPPLKESEPGQAPRTMRAQMEEHRRNPVCANCHKLMDPLGFAMENFDAVGSWRATDGGHPIDASGQLADGTPLDGVVSVRQALAGRPEVFIGTFTEKLLTFALGRGLTYRDMPAVRAIDSTAAQSGYRFSSIVLGIVNSMPFRMRINGPLPPADPAR